MAFHPLLLGQEEMPLQIPGEHALRIRTIFLHGFLNLESRSER